MKQIRSISILLKFTILYLLISLFPRYYTKTSFNKSYNSDNSNNSSSKDLYSSSSRDLDLIENKILLQNINQNNKNDKNVNIGKSFHSRLNQENQLLNKIKSIADNNIKIDNSIIRKNETTRNNSNYAYSNNFIISNDVMTLQNNPLFLGYRLSSTPPQDIEINQSALERIIQAEIDYDLIKHGLDMSSNISKKLNSLRKKRGGFVCEECSIESLFCECDEIIGLENITAYDPIIAATIKPIIKEGRCIRKNLCVDKNDCECDCKCEWVLEDSDSFCPYKLSDLEVVLCKCPCKIRDINTNNNISTRTHKSFKYIEVKNKLLDENKLSDSLSNKINPDKNNLNSLTKATNLFQEGTNNLKKK